jgi:hypothetical protein
MREHQTPWAAASTPFPITSPSGWSRRDTLAEWAGRKSDEELVAYRAEKNAVSIDGLPALDP